MASPERTPEHQLSGRQDPFAISFDHYPSIVQKVQIGFTNGVIRILFTDIDATLVLGAGHSNGEVEQSHRDARKLIADLNKFGFIIIPVTGSHFETRTKTTGSVLERIQNGILPSVGLPHLNGAFTVDAYVSDGGALAVKAIDNNASLADPHYMRFVAPPDLKYESILNKAKDVAAIACGSAFTSRERELVASYDAHAGSEKIYLQPGTSDGRHRSGNKIAFYFYAATLKERDFIEAHFKRVMEPLGLSVVCCEEKDATAAARRHPRVAPLLATEEVPLKYCLDIVPFTKGSAVQYFGDYVSSLSADIAAQRGVARPTIDIWAAGDSGNDIALMNHPLVSRAVIVGGASSELSRCAAGLSELGKGVFIDSLPGRLGPASIAAALLEQ